MPRISLLLFINMIFYLHAYAQYVEQHIEKREGLIQLSDSVSIPVEDAGYTLVLPDDKTAKGLIIYFNSDRDTIDKTFHDALPKNIGVLYVTTGNRVEFFFETEKMQQIENYIYKVISKYNIPSNFMYMGMSLAGTRALKFTIFSQSDAAKYHYKPKAIVICDSPLDFVRFWREGYKAKQLNFNEITANEGAWTSAYLETNLKGNPFTNLQAYLDYSPYAYIAPDKEKLSCFNNIHIKAYHEPDVNWWMETRRKDYYSMNSVDLAAFINELNILGNANAELITTQNKGYRPDGSRHPHSWAIVDVPGAVEWFNNIINK